MGEEQECTKKDTGGKARKKETTTKTRKVVNTLKMIPQIYDAVVWTGLI
jgi:hypothetical protein